MADDDNEDEFIPRQHLRVYHYNVQFNKQTEQYTESTTKVNDLKLNKSRVIQDAPGFMQMVSQILIKAAIGRKFRKFSLTARLQDNENDVSCRLSVWVELV